MAQFEEQLDDNEAICPYCQARHHVEAEDYNEDSRAVECDSCGRKYWLTQSFSVTHHAKPDCTLNSQEHLYERVDLKNGRQADFCTVCDHCRSVSQ